MLCNYVVYDFWFLLCNYMVVYDFDFNYFVGRYCDWSWWSSGLEVGLYYDWDLGSLEVLYYYFYLLRI